MALLTETESMVSRQAIAERRFELFLIRPEILVALFVRLEDSHLPDGKPGIVEIRYPSLPADAQYVRMAPLENTPYEGDGQIGLVVSSMEFEPLPEDGTPPIGAQRELWM